MEQRAIENWPLPERVGTCVGISNAKAFLIVWRGRTSKNSKQKGRSTTIVAVCIARYTAFVLPRHFYLIDGLIDWILSLQTIPSANYGSDSDSASRSILVMASCVTTQFWTFSYKYSQRQTVASASESGDLLAIARIAWSSITSSDRASVLLLITGWELIRIEGQIAFVTGKKYSRSLTFQAPEPRSPQCPPPCLPPGCPCRWRPWGAGTGGWAGGVPVRVEHVPCPDETAPRSEAPRHSGLRGEKKVNLGTEAAERVVKNANV